MALRFFLQDVFYQPGLVGHFLNNYDHIDHSAALKDETGLIEISCIIPANFIAAGKYFFVLRFGMEEKAWNPHSLEAFRFPEDLSFTVHNREDYIDYMGSVAKGSVRPPLDWSINKLPE